MAKLAAAFVGFLFTLFLATPVYAGDLVINEFLPRPSTGNPEWAEFYNTSNSSIDLSDYFFDDDTDFNSDSGSSAKVALSGILPTSQGCYWELSSFLNNNGDSPSIFKIDNQTTIDTYTYTDSQVDLSYARIPDGGQWQANQSPTKTQASCLLLAPPQPSPSPSPTPTPLKSPSPTPALPKSPSPSPAKITLSSPTPSPQQVLAESTSAAQLQITPSPVPQEKETVKTPKTAIILIGSGLILIGLSSAFYLWYSKLLGKDQKMKSDDD